MGPERMGLGQLGTSSNESRANGGGVSTWGLGANWLLGKMNRLFQANGYLGYVWGNTLLRAETRQCGPPSKIIFRGPLKYFSWMVIQKNEPRRGDAKLGGSDGMPPTKFCGIRPYFGGFLSILSF